MTTPAQAQPPRRVGPQLPAHERSLTPDKLWDLKRSEGLSSEAATAYVSRFHGAPPGAPAATAKPARPLQRFASSFASESTSAAPDQSSRRAAMAAEPSVLSPGGLGRELEQGATFGFGDEINAGARALFTDQSFQDALASERATMHAYEQAHPFASFAAQMAGGVVPGAGAVSAARSVGRAAPTVARLATGSRVGRAATTLAGGATFGAAAGAGSAEEDRLAGAEHGAAAGALTAGILGTTVAAARGAGRLLRPAVAQATDAVGIRQPATGDGPILNDKPGVELTLPQRAARRVGVRSANERGAEIVANTADKAGKTADDLRQELLNWPADKPVTIADLLGEGAQDLVAGTQTYSQSAAATKAPRVLSRRLGTQPARVAKDYADASGIEPIDPYRLRDQMERARKALGDDQFSEARRHGPIDDPKVLELLKRPWFDDAWREAQKDLQAGGKKLPTITRPTEKEIIFDGVPLTDADGNPRTYTVDEKVKLPTVEALDNVRQSMAGRVEQLHAQGKAFRAKQLEEPLHELTTALRGHVPIYGEALDNYSAASRLLDALKAGQAAAGQDPRQAALAFEQLASTHEKVLFRAALQDAKLTEMAKTNKASTILPKDEFDDYTHSRGRIVARDEANGAELEKRGNQERRMIVGNKRMLSGSNTMNKAAARETIDEGVSPADVAGAITSPTRLVKLTLRTQLRNRLRGLNANTADAVADRLLAGAGENGRAEIAKVLDELAALEKAGKLTPKKTRELLKLPAAAEAGRDVGGSK